MACRQKVKRLRFSCLVSLHIVGVCKRLELLISVRLVVRHVMPMFLRIHLTELLGLPVYLRMVDCGEVLFVIQFLAYGVEELDSNLLPVVS